MTDLPTSNDELVSAYLDGAATDEEVARVEADPLLLARSDELRAAIELAATEVPIPVADLDRIRATAVASSTTSTTVRSLGAAAEAKRARAQQRTRLMAVAAAFVFLALGVASIRSFTSQQDDDSAVADFAGDSASSADGAALEPEQRDGGDDHSDDDSAEEFDDSGASSESAEAATDSAATDLDESALDLDDSTDDSADDGADDSADDGDTTGIAPTTSLRLALPAQLPPVATFAELTELVEDTFASGSTTTTPLLVESVPCPDTFAEAFGTNGVNFQAADYAEVTVGGSTHVVGALEQADGSLAIVAVATFDCLPTVLGP